MEHYIYIVRLQCREIGLKNQRFSSPQHVLPCCFMRVDKREQSVKHIDTKTGCLKKKEHLGPDLLTVCGSAVFFWP